MWRDREKLARRLLLEIERARLTREKLRFISYVRLRDKCEKGIMSQFTATHTKIIRRQLRGEASPAEAWLWQNIRRGACDGAVVHRKAWVNPKRPGEGAAKQDDIQRPRAPRQGTLVDFWIPSRLLAVQITSTLDLPLPYRTLRYSEAEVMQDGERVLYEIGMVCASVGDAWGEEGEWEADHEPGLTYRVGSGERSAVACDTRPANEVLRRHLLSHCKREA